MKKLLSLTSVALLGVVALTGCSCGKNGEYTFSHFEYEVDGKTKKTDCKSTEGLPTQVKVVCSLKPNDTDIEYVIDGNLLTDKDSGITYFFKVEDKKIMVALTEDGTYSDILGLTYENSSIKLVSRGVTWVYDN